MIGQTCFRWIPRRPVGTFHSFSTKASPEPTTKVIGSPNSPQTAREKLYALFTWVKQTAKEKGKPFIAWYAALYLGGLAGSYGIVRAYGQVEPDTVKYWAKKLHIDSLGVDVDGMELSKRNCEYMAALLLNEAVDTPRLILAVLTIDRVILIGRKILAKK